MIRIRRIFSLHSGILTFSKRFTRCDVLRSSADSSRHGMGIGLSLCAAIVKAHGGEIWAESKPGQGTKICFWLLTDINQTEEVQDEQ